MALVILEPFLDCGAQAKWIIRTIAIFNLLAARDERDEKNIFFMRAAKRSNHDIHYATLCIMEIPAAVCPLARQVPESWAPSTVVMNWFVFGVYK